MCLMFVLSCNLVAVRLVVIGFCTSQVIDSIDCLYSDLRCVNGRC